MECESAHAVIEKRKKNREMHTPAQYVQVIREARLKNPYKVHYVSHDFFKDYSELRSLSSIRPGVLSGEPQVVDIRCLQYLANGIVNYKLRPTDVWQPLPMPRSARQGNNGIIKPLYTSSRAIKLDKYNDLQSLKSVILPDFHGFYDGLRHA